MDQFIELIGENGTEVFELLLRFKFKGKDYIALRPEKEDEDSAAVFEVRKMDDGEENYISIADDRMAKEVFVHFVSIWEMAQEMADEDDSDAEEEEYDE